MSAAVLVRMRTSALLLLVCTVACSGSSSEPDDPWTDGKGDGFGADRTIDVVLTEPFCDVCTADDKAVLVARSKVTQRIVELIDGAQAEVDIANFTFSVRAIEDAVL